MDQNAHAHAVEGPDFKGAEKEFPDLNQMLEKVDRILAEFYEIHGPHIKDQGQEP